MFVQNQLLANHFNLLTVALIDFAIEKQFYDSADANKSKMIFKSANAF